MVQDPPGIAHPGAGHDQAGAVHVVQRLGFLGGYRGLKRIEVVLQRLLLDLASQIVVEQFAVLAVDLRRLDGHRAVQIDGELGQQVTAEDAGQDDQQQLGAADGKRGHQDLAVAGDGRLQDLPKLLYGFLERLVIAAAVGGFQKYSLGLVKRLGIFEDRRAFGPQVAGEHDGLGAAVVWQGQVDAGRAEHVAGFDPARGHAGGHLDGFVVGNGTELGHRGFHVLDAVQRFLQFLPGPLAAAIDPFDVLGLDLGRIAEDQVASVRRSPACRRSGASQRPLTSRGSRPVWSRWAWVSSTASSLRGFRSRGTTVPLLRLGHALEQAEINQQAGLRSLDQISGTGDIAAGSAV